jgi:hypothetical protein
VGPEPSGGVTIQVKGIDGLPGVSLLIPIVKDSADEFYSAMGEFLTKTKVFTNADMKKETHGLQ